MQLSQTYISMKETNMGYMTETELALKNQELLQAQPTMQLSVDIKPSTSIEIVGSDYQALTINDEKTITSKDLELKNLIDLLTYISRAGWLSTHVIALLMRPRIDSKIKFAQKLLRKALARGYITKHPLPEGKSFAYCLTDKGTTFLRTNNINVARPYRLRVDNGYQVPSDWRHHILSTSTLALLQNQLSNSRILFEREVRINFPNIDKIPDGLLLRDNKKGLWLEVERGEKKPNERDKILELITDSYYSKLTLLPEIKNYEIVIVFDHNQRNEKGHLIHHQEIYTNHFKSNTRKSEIGFSFGKLELSKGNVQSITIKNTPIFSSKVEKMASDLHFSKGWTENHQNAKIPNSVGLYFDKWCAEFKRVDDTTFYWLCSDYQRTRKGKVVDFEDALRFISATMVMLRLSFDNVVVIENNSLDDWSRD